MKKIMLIICSLFFIPNVFAYVNKGLSDDLVLPSSTAIRYYGWSSESAYTQRPLAYSADYDDYQTDFRRAYYYLTNPDLKNDSQGFSFLVNTGIVLAANQNFDYTVVLCSTNSNTWWSSYRVGVGAWDTARTNYADKGGQTWSDLGRYETDGTDFTMCRKLSFNFTTKSSGSVINLRLSSPSQVALGQLSFMGYSLSSNGYDFTSTLNTLTSTVNGVNDNLNTLTTTVNGLQSSIQSGTQDIINNQNANQQQTNDKLDGINDSLTDSSVNDNTGNSFFSGFQDNDHGLSSIILAPINILRNIFTSSTGTCSNLTFTYHNKNVSLPCGKIFWNRAGIDVFYNFYNLVVGGFLCYCIIRSLFIDIEELKDPAKDKVDVMNL